jgi:hypothetical protein
MGTDRHLIPAGELAGGDFHYAALAGVKFAVCDGDGLDVWHEAGVIVETVKNNLRQDWDKPQS